MSAASGSSGDNAKIWTGIRDIPIWAGESSRGNQLWGGPYRMPELVAIGLILIPAIVWVTHNVASPHVLAVVVGAPLITVIVVLVLRVVIPSARPTLGVRLQFMVNVIVPRPLSTSLPAPARRRHGAGSEHPNSSRSNSAR
ncbi:hypothetical protein [Mycolicibacter arupensis]|jgi:hypothetical protein|uniref:hypothetical protein n=1 Tax=Mycolicibacter arupensis TaxID=342002 RepID=UPI0023F036BC|nr:hypothetical protein [Mycolicibacter arupensis]